LPHGASRFFHRRQPRRSPVSAKAQRRREPSTIRRIVETAMAGFTSSGPCRKQIRCWGGPG
jgi:hypothetical protein